MDKTQAEKKRAEFMQDREGQTLTATHRLVTEIQQWDSGWPNQSVYLRYTIVANRAVSLQLGDVA